MKHIAIRTVFLATVMLAGIISAVVIHCSFQPGSIDSYKTVSELMGSDILIGHQIYSEGIVGAPDWETEDEIYQSYVSAYDNMDYHLIVKATGNIKTSYLATFQEFEIIEVLKGNLPKGEHYYCDFSGARIEQETDGLRLNSYGVNLMQKGREYLLFCDSCDMSNYSDDTYVIHGGGISYYALDNDHVAIVNDSEIAYNEDTAQYEFFVDDEKTIEQIINFKKKILDEYLNPY